MTLKKKVRAIRKKLESSLPDSVFCKLANLKSTLLGRPLRIHRQGDGPLFTVSDGVRDITICRRGRYRLNKRGVDARCAFLSSTYHLDRVDLAPGDVIVDCGANIGELGRWAKARQLRYIAIEPEELEARCADLNAYDGAQRTQRLGLWKSDTTLELFSKPESADSSFIEIEGYKQTRLLPVRRLDSLATELGLDRIRVLKLEAEGAEPEVLEGASGIIDRIDYVAVDCGAERGIAKAHTFVEVTNVLQRHGFEVVAARFDYVRILFRNTRTADRTP